MEQNSKDLEDIQEIIAKARKLEQQAREKEARGNSQDVDDLYIKAIE